jgi:RNase H-fold protein (predicted Holliday junction resolvase)
MTTIVIKPKTKQEQDFLTRLLKKLNVEMNLVEEPLPNYETKMAMEDVLGKKGNKAKDAKDLFAKLDI